MGVERPSQPELQWMAVKKLLCPQSVFEDINLGHQSTTTVKEYSRGMKIVNGVEQAHLRMLVIP